MELTDSQIKSIVGEVMARMQLNTEVSSMHGVFADMNTAIEKAKEAQKTVRMMSMDQRIAASQLPVAARIDKDAASQGKVFIYVSAQIIRI